MGNEQQLKYTVTFKCESCSTKLMAKFFEGVSVVNITCENCGVNYLTDRPSVKKLKKISA